MKKYPELPVVDTVAIGTRIRDLRERNRIRVEDIQEYLGFGTPQAVYKWQRGDNLPTVDNLLALSELFHTSVDYILKGGDAEEADASSVPFMGILPAVIIP